MAGFDSIIYEKADGRVRLTLNRPEKLNAITMRMMEQLNEALWEADNDRDVHCVIVKGAGRAFCSGYDLRGDDSNVPVSRIQSEENRYRGGRSIDDDAWQLERAQRYRMALFDMHKPSICQVHGFCLAGGTDIALLCDMVIAADDATFGFPPARDLGALPNNMWLYNVGPQWAKRLTMTGDTVTGKEAQQIGLVMKSVPREHLEARGRAAGRSAGDDRSRICCRRTNASSTSALELHGRAHAAAAGRGERRARPQHARRRRVPPRVRDGGLAAALKERDQKFGDGRARVNGPEIRDAAGRLVDD